MDPEDKSLDVFSPDPDGESIPQPFSPQRDVPSELLAISLNFPYSTQEWDDIFDTLIELLGYQDYRVWNGAIDRLVQALEIEESQTADCDEYQPRATSERLESIFGAIATQSLQNPDLFERFCRKFQYLATREPYHSLGMRWLVQLMFLEHRQLPTEAAIASAQRLFRNAVNVQR
jgi:hypothetical protein